MKYTYSPEVRLAVEPQEFDKNSPKEILQYAVGGLLYMPATQKNVAQKIIDGRFNFVKSMVLDLEDSLGDDMIGAGQRNIVNVINEIAKAVESEKISISDVPLIFVRVREPDQILETMDMLKEKIVYLTGFNVPKFDKYCCKEYIKNFQKALEYAHSIDGTELYIMPILENKTTLYRQLRMDNLLFVNDALREIANNVLNIRMGGADFCHILGIRRDVNYSIYDIGVIRSCINDIINVFGKSYVVSGPVWEYFGTPEGEEGLRRELRHDKMNGIIGKTSIHPTQLPIIQEAHIVNNADYMDALGVLGMNENTTGVQKSASGRMNEVKTHGKWAKKIMNLAYVYGVKAKEETPADTDWEGK